MEKPDIYGSSSSVRRIGAVTCSRDYRPFAPCGIVSSMTSRGRTAVEAAEPHGRELALFLSVHRDRAPGLLWPEYEHPAYRADATTAAVELLASSLERATGRPVRTVREGGNGRTVHYEAVPDHVMVHQTTGAGDWLVSASPSAAPVLQCRLRASEVLYVPPQHAWRAELSSTARYLVTYIGANVVPGLTR